MYISGKNGCLTVLEKNIKINKAFISLDFSDETIITYLEKNKINYTRKEKFELDKLVSKNHQGIILDIEDYKYCDIDELMVDEALVIMLDHLEDPHNLGAIIRTAEALGVTGVIIPKNRTVEVNDTVVRTSAGTVFNVKIAQVNNLVNAMNQMKKNGFWIVGTDMSETNLSEVDFNGKSCIVIGNEGRGMSRLVKENCDFVASIKMLGEVNSLNASVAAGIIIFEAQKNRRKLWNTKIIMTMN